MTPPRAAAGALALAVLAVSGCGQKLPKESEPSPELEAPAPAEFGKETFKDERGLREKPASWASGPAAEAPTAPEGMAAQGMRMTDSTSGRVIQHKAGLAICTDGNIAKPEWRRWAEETDTYHLSKTAMLYAPDATHKTEAQRSLDPTVVPYWVLPGGYKHAQKGDLALVSRVVNGEKLAQWAIGGEVGPAGKFGEGSVALALALKINPHGDKGGVGSGVTYLIFPGTRHPGKFANEQELMAYLAKKSAELQEKHFAPAPVSETAAR